MTFTRRGDRPHLLFFAGLIATLLVALPAFAEPLTGLDDIKLGEESRTAACGAAGSCSCVLGDLDAIALEMKRMAQSARPGSNQHPLDDRAARRFELPACG